MGGVEIIRKHHLIIKMIPVMHKIPDKHSYLWILFISSTGQWRIDLLVGFPYDNGILL
jgi:hypothetical protein